MHARKDGAFFGVFGDLMKRAQGVSFIAEKAGGCWDENDDGKRLVGRWSGGAGRGGLRRRWRSQEIESGGEKDQTCKDVFHPKPPIRFVG